MYTNFNAEIIEFTDYEKSNVRYFVYLAFNAIKQTNCIYDHLSREHHAVKGLQSHVIHENLQYY